MTTNNDTLTLSVADLDQVLPSEYTVLPPGDPRNDNPHALRALLNEESSQTYFFSSALEYLKFAVTVASRNRLLAENCGTRYIQLPASYDSDAYFHASVTHTVAAFTRNSVVLHRINSDETSVRIELSRQKMKTLLQAIGSTWRIATRPMDREEPRVIRFLTFLMAFLHAYWLIMDAGAAPAQHSGRSSAMPKKNQQYDELEAFCHSCTAPEQVISFLERLGVRLDFQMDAFLPPAYSELAQLPAQFHFEDASGMSIIYLAGEDRAPEDGEHLPPHQSRFWAYPGADAHVFDWITQSMAHQWSFTWLRLSQARQDVA